jgi:hypothetical protein
LGRFSEIAAKVTQDPAPKEVAKRIDRGTTAMERYLPTWVEALAFFDNDQYVERSAVHPTGVDRLETREGGTKARYQLRNVFNRYTPKLLEECAMLASRTPGFECVPMNGDPSAQHGARLGEKALLGAYELLELDTEMLDLLIHAANCGAAWLWPYWNPGMGAVLDYKDGKEVRNGELACWRLQQDELLWEPSVNFDDSHWLCIRKAQPVDFVTSQSGYRGPKQLKPDAVNSLIERRERGGDADLVFVYHYLEKPSEAHQRGRWLTLANGQQIDDQRDWPCRAPNGQAQDAIHRLSWIRRPHRHRDMGVGELMVDPQRSYSRTRNQVLEWKNLVLNPQLLAPVGSITEAPTKQPGKVVFYRPIGGREPRWREVPDIPASYFEVMRQSIADLDEIIGSNFPGDTEGAAHVQALNEREVSRRGLVVRSQARFWGNLGYHLLYLMQQNYDDPRFMPLQGRFGVSLLEGFRGQELTGIRSVRVSAASIEPRTRASVEAKIAMYAQNKWIEPHQAMAAMQGGTAEKLIDDFELDIARQSREIEQIIRVGEQPAPEMPEVDPEYALAMLQEHIVTTIPQVEVDVDNHRVHVDVLKQYMKTRDYELLDDVVKGALRMHLIQHQQALQIQLQQEMAITTGMAEGMGTANAAVPAGQKPLPSQPSLGSQAEGLR